MLEKMANFFENRLSDYDEHMRRDIFGAKEFYPFTAACLPACPGAKVLDLGCGTGLELEDYYKINKSADITGIDLSQGMLEKLAQKFPDKKLTLICGSYFEEDMGLEVFDAAVSVESLHHFTKEEKIPLYKKLFDALKCDANDDTKIALIKDFDSVLNLGLADEVGKKQENAGASKGVLRASCMMLLNAADISSSPIILPIRLSAKSFLPKSFCGSKRKTV